GAAARAVPRSATLGDAAARGRGPAGPARAARTRPRGRAAAGPRLAGAGAADRGSGPRRQSSRSRGLPRRRGRRLRVPAQALGGLEPEVRLPARRRLGGEGQVRPQQRGGLRGGRGHAPALRARLRRRSLVRGAGGELPAGCSLPFAILQDVGETFGPRGVDLDGWRRTPVWADAGTCRVSMKDLPYQGATFGEARITEAGRRLLADELRQLSPAQV